MILIGGVTIKTYTVNQIALLLKTNPETVRRWIRTGKLTAIQNSKKSGNIITDIELTKFVQKMPKYAGLLTATSLNMPLALGAICGIGLGLGVLSALEFFNVDKNTRISVKDIEGFLKKEITVIEGSIASKNKMIEQLQGEVVQSQKQILEYKSILEADNLKQLADEINAKKTTNKITEVANEK